MSKKTYAYRIVGWLRGKWAPLWVRARFKFGGLRLHVHDGVLNPTLFTASKRFAREVAAWLPQSPCSVLELGCGCGLASLIAAAKGHEVQAVDVDANAVANTAENAALNGLKLSVWVSDWDEALAEGRVFDRIICNPPFLPNKTPSLETALYAGDGGAHFDTLVAAIARRLSPNGKAMVMTSSQTDRSDWLRAVSKQPRLRIEPYLSRGHWQERLLFDELRFD